MKRFVMCFFRRRLGLSLLPAVLLAAAAAGPLRAGTPAGSIRLSDPAILAAPERAAQADRFNLYVDPALDEAACGRFCFRSLREALLAAEALQRESDYCDEQPLTLHIAPSVYWIDDPDDPEVRRPEEGENAPIGLKLKLSHLRLIGLSDDPEDTVVASNRGQTQGALGNFTMLCFEGDDIRAENLTFGNYCNVDLVYRRDPSLNRRRRGDAIVQAQLIFSRGDRIVARNCRFISRLNLCPFAGARRALFERCHFECTDDALCGTGVYVGCTFTFFSSKPFYATQGTGAVFIDCDLHSLCSGEQYLVKMGSPVTMIDCRWSSEDPALRLGWTAYPTGDQRSYQSGVTLNGRPVLIDAEHPVQTVNLTGKPLLRAYNLYNLLRGDDSWNPTQSDPSLPVGPTQLRLSRREATIESGVDTLLLVARAFRPAAAEPEPADRTPVQWRVRPEDAGTVLLQPDGRGNCTVLGTNGGEEPRVVEVLASTADGLESACVVTVHPKQLPPPAFVALPQIRREGNRLTVDYRLDLAGRADRSAVTWYRCTAAGEIPVAMTHTDTPQRTYTLTDADNGCRLKAVVAPRNPRSSFGEAAAAVTRRPVSGAPVAKRLETDFSDFPTLRQPQVVAGCWTSDTFKPADTREHGWAPAAGDAWYYGYGEDAARANRGLVQTTRGARLLYLPAQACSGDMEVTLEVDPAKSAGQGFGSATGQYMDIFVRFDPATLTGYGLRIIRTPEYDSAVEFVLMAYRNGRSEPLCAPVASTCYRTTCTLRLRIAGDRFTAEASTTAPATSASLPNAVSLEVAVEPLPQGAFGIQHTGSTGGSATMLRHLRIDWK